MSGESKTVSELCREALELRGKATQGEWYHACESILGGNTHVVFTGLDGDLVERGYDGLLRKSSNATPNAAFTIFAANHIKQIAERCLELEKDLVLVRDSHKRQGELNTKAWAENQKLREALEGLTNAALAWIKPLQSQVEAGFEALKGGQGE